MLSYAYTSSIYFMKKISSTEYLMFIIVAIYLTNLNLNEMNTLSWIGFSVSILWLILFIFEHILFIKKRREDL